MRRSPIRVALLLAGLLAAGCTVTSQATRPEGAATPAKGQRILVMDPDVELYVLTAGGLLEPNAEWTAAAQGHVASALVDELGRKGLEARTYAPPEDPTRKHAHDQLLKLHDTVAGVMVGGGFQLPTMKGRLGWSLGDGAQALRHEQPEAFALFVLLRDSYASAGRRATGVGVAILTLGTVAMPMGQQRGAASLVDLRTGEIVWFNQLFSSTGDLRTAKAAQQAVHSLLGNLPQ